MKCPALTLSLVELSGTLPANTSAVVGPLLIHMLHGPDCAPGRIFLPQTQRE